MMMPGGGGFFPPLVQENDEVGTGTSHQDDEERAAADHYCGQNESTIDDSNSYQPSTSQQEYRIIPSSRSADDPLHHLHSSFDDDCSSSVLSQEEHHHHKVKVPQHAPHHKNGIEIEEGHCMTFPEKLMHILSNPEYHEVLSWLEHGKGWIIHDRKRFSEEIMPVYFGKQTKYTSFTRKLNRWEFIRVTRGSEVGAFYHPFFRKGEPELCKRMTCMASKFRQAIQPMNPVALGLSTSFTFDDLTNGGSYINDGSSQVLDRADTAGARQLLVPTNENGQSDSPYYYYSHQNTPYVEVISGGISPECRSINCSETLSAVQAQPSVSQNQKNDHLADHIQSELERDNLSSYQGNPYNPRPFLQLPSLSHKDLVVPNIHIQHQQDVHFGQSLLQEKYAFPPVLAATMEELNQQRRRGLKKVCDMDRTQTHGFK